MSTLCPRPSRSLIIMVHTGKGLLSHVVSLGTTFQAHIHFLSEKMNIDKHEFNVFPFEKSVCRLGAVWLGRWEGEVQERGWTGAGRAGRS